MQLTLLLTAALFSISSIAQDDDSGLDDSLWTITGLNDKQASAWSSYQSAITNDKAYTSYVVELQTATYEDFTWNPSAQSSAFQAAVTGTATAIPSIPTQLPADAQKFVSSYYNAEMSILTKYRSGNNAAAAAPTGVLLAAGAAAAGVMGYAAM